MMNEADFYWLALGILSTWRVTHLLQAEDGPWDVVLRLRRMAGNGFIGAMLDCFACLSLWIALLPACLLARSWQHGGLLWLACSAGAMLLQRSGDASHQAASPAAYFIEDKEE